MCQADGQMCAQMYACMRACAHTHTHTHTRTLSKNKNLNYILFFPHQWPDAEEIPTKEDLYQTLEDPLYSDFRAEAYEHYKQRQECLKKAAIAYRKGMLQVASYYSQQSQLHYEKLKDANHRTAEMIVNYK